MDDQLAIKVDNVSKTFRLPHEKQTSLKGALIHVATGGKRTYERQQVLKDISFEVRKGEFFGIVGRNGSGKSTLLKLLAGIYEPSKGGIRISGRLTPFIELGVGFNHELTGRENVYLNGALMGFNRKEMSAMYDDIVEFAELKRFMDQKLKNYSSGMQVRLAFSIAIRAQSDILLIDEVLAVGDAAFQRKCFDYFMQIKKEKRTMILVTHDMGAVNQYCDKAMMIDEGKIVKKGQPDDVSQAYRRLFNDELSGEGAEFNTMKDGNRWGTGKLMAENTMITVDDEYITVRCTYVAKAALPPPVLGFTIYGPSGNNVLEGNTMRKKYKTLPLKPGDKAKMTWKVPNIFATGRYEVSVACCDQSVTEFYDWANKAASFIINKEGSTAGMVDPSLKIEDYTVGSWHGHE